MNRAGIFSGIGLAAALVVAAGCWSGEDNEPVAAKETIRQLPPIAGTPTDAGYFDGHVKLLGGADPAAGPSRDLVRTVRLVPLAIRLELEDDATLLFDEYTLIVDERRYQPQGVSFGKARRTFFDVTNFAADKIELTLEGSDQITTNAAGRLSGCRLAAGEVYLLYRVPGSAVVTLHYDGRDYEFIPTDAVVLGVEKPASGMSTAEAGAAAGSQGLQVEVKRGQLGIGTIDGEQTEVFELKLTLKSSKYEAIDLHLGRDFYLQGHAVARAGNRPPRGGSNRSGRVFVEIQEDRIRMLQGTDYYNNTYKETEMKELIDGGVSISLQPGRPVTAYFVFPNPPFQNGLALHFPGQPPLDLVPAGDLLGEIRPAIPRGVTRIPRAPLIGDPVKVHVIEGNIPVDAGGRQPTSQGPGGGNRFVVLQFAIEGECEFVPRDYLLRDTSGQNFYPQAAAFGDAPAQRIPGDGYQGVKLVPGDTDVVRRRKGELLDWQYTRPEVLVVFAVPETLATFEFSHGDRLLKITPVTPPLSWKELRPDKAVAAADSPRGQATGKTKKSPPNPALRAATQVRLGKLLLKKDADDARRYFEEAIRLAPQSPAAEEARQLLQSLD